MRNLRIRSAYEQLADFLKEEIRSRTWTGAMPGETWLVTHLQVGRDTVRAAMTHLEEEGVITSQGQGQRRQIVMNSEEFAKNYRVTLLLHSPNDRQDELIHNILFQLAQRGYQVEMAPKSLVEMGMKVERVAHMVKQVETDAWVVVAASSDVLEWFASQAAPAFAIYGRFSRRSMAGIGPDKFPAYQTAIRRLVELGHRRIVFLLPEQARKPKLGLLARKLLEEMEIQGIATGTYHLPDWERGPAGLRKCVDRIFELTPPTALIVDEACEFIAVQHHLARRGIFAPKDISLICSDGNPIFEWCEPSVSYIRCSNRPVVRRVVHWVDHIASGKDDHRKSFSKAEFVEGGTIGPVCIHR
jgi:DNA-binding LacI/PurR family transcriptional regulator